MIMGEYRRIEQALTVDFYPAPMVSRRPIATITQLYSRVLLDQSTDPDLVRHLVRRIAKQRSDLATCHALRV